MTDSIPTSDTMSEAEMRAFFERLVSKVVSLSAQAVELVQLKSDVQAMSQRLDNFARENDWLRSQLESTTKERDRLTGENEGLKQAAEIIRRDHEAAQALLAESDQKVQRQADRIGVIEGELRESRTVLQNTVHERDTVISERDELRQQVEQANVAIANLQSIAKSDGDTIRAQYDDNQRLTRELAASNEALTRVRNAVNALPSF